MAGHEDHGVARKVWHEEGVKAMRVMATAAVLWFAALHAAALHAAPVQAAPVQAAPVHAAALQAAPLHAASLHAASLHAAALSDQDWAALRDRFVEEWFAINPTAAVAAGRHEFDGQVPDLTSTGYAARVALFRRYLDAARAVQAIAGSDDAYERDLLV
jgi:hypothetical protein